MVDALKNDEIEYCIDASVLTIEALYDVDISHLSGATSFLS